MSFAPLALLWPLAVGLASCGSNVGGSTADSYDAGGAQALGRAVGIDARLVGSDAGGAQAPGRAVGIDARLVRVDAGGNAGGMGEVGPASVCPAVLSRPETRDCDGVPLAAAAAIEAQSPSLATTPGPDGAMATCIGDNQSIDILDQGCFQLTDGEDPFSDG